MMYGLNMGFLGQMLTAPENSTPRLWIKRSVIRIHPAVPALSFFLSELGEWLGHASG
jgi:hypothetical protein